LRHLARAPLVWCGHLAALCKAAALLKRGRDARTTGNSALSCGAVGLPLAPPAWRTVLDASARLRFASAFVVSTASSSRAGR